MISSGHPMYEEEEAKLKRCCGPEGCGDGRPKRYCVASDCMAWRLQPLMADPAFAEAVKARAEKTGDKDPSRRDSAAYVLAHRSEYDLHDKPFMGYCGLAGGFLT